MSKAYELMAIGEFLVDAISIQSEGALALEGHAGGAPANMLATASKLGRSTALIAKVGEDGFGRYLRQCLHQFGVSDRYVAASELPTTLAIVTLDEQGDRSFHFYRKHTADIMLLPEEIPCETIASARLLHFCSMPLTDQPSRDATMLAIRHASDCGVQVSFDPNWRPTLWESTEAARHWIEQGMAYTDIAKLSEEELFLLVEADSHEDGIRQLMQRYPRLKLAAVTLGAAGCLCLTADGLLCSAPGFSVNCIDTTGAGDAFCAGMLSFLLERGSERDSASLSEGELLELMRFANAVGALSTTEKGGFPTQLNEQRIQALLAQS